MSEQVPPKSEKGRPRPMSLVAGKACDGPGQAGISGNHKPNIATWKSSAKNQTAVRPGGAVFSHFPLCGHPVAPAVRWDYPAEGSDRAGIGHGGHPQEVTGAAGISGLSSLFRRHAVVSLDAGESKSDHHRSPVCLPKLQSDIRDQILHFDPSRSTDEAICPSDIPRRVTGRLRRDTSPTGDPR